jgi:quinol monooxygenase YgiN
MITYLAKITARPGRKAELVDFLRWDADVAAADEPGTLRFDVYDVADEPAAVYLYEAYSSADAFAVHRDGPPFKRFVEEIVPNVIADIEFLLRGATSVAANA